MSESKDWHLLIAGLIGAVLGAALLATGMFLGQPSPEPTKDSHARHTPHTEPLGPAVAKSNQAVTEALLRQLLDESASQRRREPVAAVAAAVAPLMPPEPPAGTVATRPEPEEPDVSLPLPTLEPREVPQETVPPAVEPSPVVTAPPAPGTGRKLVIVTTTTDMKSIAEAIGGERIQVTSLATGYEDPHFIQAKPSYMMRAKKADLWIRIGMSLEIGYERLILDGSRNSKIRVGSRGHLDASVGVLRLEVPTTKVDRSMGDVHPMGNPHYWLDPLNGRIIAGTLEERMSELSPGDAKFFAYNLEQFRKRLDEAMFGKALVAKVGGGRLWALVLSKGLEAELEASGLDDKIGGWYAAMKPHAGKKIVTYHRSRSYFVHRFGLVVADELEPKPGIPPSPGHVANVIGRMKAEGVKVITMQPLHSREAPDLVARETGAEVVLCANSVGGQKEAADYIALIDNLVKRLSAALAKQ